MIVLDCKTDYSFMRGFGTPQEWLARCKEVGVTVLGVADYCSTWGHIPFRDAFKGSGIKLLYGVQLPVVVALDKDPRHSLVTLIAKSSLKELYAATTKAFTQTYYRPRLTWKQVAELQDCVVILNDVLKQHVRHAYDVPGLYMGPAQNLWMKNIPVPLVPAYGPRFPSQELRQGFALMRANSEAQRLGDVNTEEDYHLMREGELRSTFKFADDTYANADIIAKSANADIPVATLLDMGVEGNKTEALSRLAYEGAMKRGLVDGSWTMPLAYDNRLKHELSVIKEKSFEDYFFFVADICRFANEHMFVGPGRGSAGGSLLCYLLGITQVDPLKHGTLFERFIDVTRSDLPDIDVDFPDTRREEIFEYLRAKYGAECVARIGTLTELGGKSAINAVARATGVPFEAAREIGKWTEGAGQGVVISPQWVFDNVNEVEGVLARHPSLRMAALLDGHVSHHGVHASGVIVTDDPISNYGSVTRDGVISMDMKSAEKQNLVKMDALGLRTLSVIQETCDLAGINPRSLYDLDWNDADVFDRVFNQDRVTGIFQFEGHAVRTLMKQVRVDKFDDLCALTSLARPGPLIGGAAGGWVKARNGEAVDELLHPALEKTYGVICYQEQFMAIARDVAGFDVAQVNGMRRAVAKKDPEKLRSYRDAFIGGVCDYLGRKAGEHLPEHIDFSVNLWEEICEFGSYAFNYSHAVAYSMISYMTAWLKIKHPLEFAVAQLRNAPDDDAAKNLLRELTEEGYQYVPFDAERSLASWAIVEGKLYGGFTSLKGVGEKTAERFVAARTNNPSGWIDALTEAQRNKVLNPRTPFDVLSYFTTKYRALYADPGAWKTGRTPKGIKPPVYRLRDLPEPKGNYAFLGRITMKKLVDANDPEKVAKRDGKRYDKDTTFINLTIEDDTGEVGATINRFKAAQFQWLIDEDLGGRDFLFRGNVIEEGRRWLFLENVIEVGDAGDQGVGG